VASCRKFDYKIFFHLTTKWRKARNAIKGIKIQEVWLEDLKGVKVEVKEYLEKRFNEIIDFKVKLGNLGFEKIGGE